MINKGEDKTQSIVGTALYLQMWGQVFKNTSNEAFSGHYLEMLGKWHFLKNGKNNVSWSCLSQHAMSFANASGIHKVLYGACCCAYLMTPRNETLKAPAILRFLKIQNS